MREDILSELIEKSSRLTAEEQLRLIAALAEKVRMTAIHKSGPRRKWSDLAGALSYPACGEDAQVHISRSRRESDENRHIDPTR
jgi:hypothetical protein